MSLQFITGNSGSGKSQELFQRVIDASIANPKGHFLVVVPEQFTMQTQKELVELHPDKGILNIDILSFQRLAYRVFEEVGSDKRVVLDETGKNLLIRKAAIQKKEELQVLGAYLGKTGYITQMKSMISELMQYDVTEEKFQKMQKAAEKKPQLFYKLSDVGVLYQEFRRMMRERYVTADEVLEILCQVAEKSKLLKGCMLALDGFTGFTPIQMKLLRKLLVIADEVLVTITLDARENPYRIYGEHELFYLSKRTMHNLNKLAREEKVLVREPYILGKGGAFRFREAPVLGFLEQNLFRFGKEIHRFELGCDEISIHLTRDPQTEAHFIARMIKKLTREGGVRYQDIAVITGDMASYGTYFQKVFGVYEIPCFLDETKNILLNPFVEFIRSVIEAVQNNFSYESMFRLLRTGLCGIGREETDLLENYVLACGIRGVKKWSEEWERLPKSFGPELLQTCNELRTGLMERLLPFSEVLKDRKSLVKDYAKALYGLITACEIQQALKEYEVSFEQQGKLNLAREYAQIYGIVMELLDKLVELLGEERIGRKEFAGLLEAGFEEAKVGIIPPTVDQILVGDLERTRLKEIKILFLSGLNDGWVPKSKGGGGLLSDLDREELKNSDIELAPTARENMYIQRFYLYLNMTKPSRRLYLSCSKVNGDGKTLRPSYVIQTIQNMFPGVSVCDEDHKEDLLEQIECKKNGLDYFVAGLQNIRTEKPGAEWFVVLDYLSQEKDMEIQIQNLLDAAFYVRPDRGLPRSIASSLYGMVLENSVTRLEQFAACAYSHFLMYGLGLKEREIYEFKPMDMGNIFHQVMELFSRKVEQSGYGWFELPDDVRDQLTEETVSEVAGEYGEKILYSSSRNEYAIERMKRIMRRTIWALHSQIRMGSFLPSSYEVSFSMAGDLNSVNIALSQEERMRLKGRIDRIDVKEEEDQVYVKVIDYKSGNTSFDLVALYYGLQLQLVVYLNAALELEKRIHPDKEIIPAGIFYYNMKDPMLDREPMDTPETINERLLKKLKLSGLVNSEEEILKKMDTNLTKDSNVIPVTLNKDGSPSKTSGVADRTQFDRLSGYVNEKMTQIGKEILNGKIEAKPYERKDKTACDYCVYKEICRFDEKIPGNRYQRLREYKPEEIWKKLQEKEAADPNEMDS